MILIGKKCVKKQAETSGHLYIATVAAGAFFWSADNDYSAYTGDGSNNGYLLKFFDSTNAHVGTAYGGAVGTGAAGGDLDATENVTNGDFETGDPPSSWSVAGTGAVLSADADARTGLQALKIYADAAAYRGLAYQTINDLRVNGGLWKLQAYAKKIDAPFARVYVSDDINNTNYVYYKSISAPVSYTDVGGYFTSKSSTDTLSLYSPDTQGKYGLWDDVSLKRVTEPPNTGLRLYSTRTGSTQTMKETGAGNPNTITKVEIWSAQ